MTEQHVELVHVDQDNPQVRWNPSVGEETVRLLSASDLDDEGEALVRRESLDVLARCADPGTDESRTGLVVGYVQSGKTMSFTTVISLARDNRFPLIVLLAGTKQNLHEQTAARLSHDLEVEREGGLSPWSMLENPTKAVAADLAGDVRSMLDPKTPEQFRRATVITVMKNKSRLNRVQELLEALGQHGLDLAEVPVLVVDDEADQAGLNAAAQDDDKDPTATYQAIVDLRAVLPRHTYLMYTATPQAPLLINLADVLSPDFVSVLTPGSGYTGGEYFFERHQGRFVHRLTPSEVTDALNATDKPPATLKTALASYYLVVAQRGKGPVSMLVHPSHTQRLQQVYGTFVTNLSSQWRTLLDTPGEDREQLVSRTFQPAYDDLVDGGATMRPLEELLGLVPHWMGQTRIRVVNSQAEADQQIRWGTAPSWILIGGNKLDRGFTVEGLATTYMPRRIGAGQVDSVQQRARFFGYKRSYADLCRAWLNGTTAEAFVHYVEHERRLRAELVEVDRKGLSLRHWKRLMLLDPAYKPTRRAVIDIEYFHDRIKGDSWSSTSKVPPSPAVGRTPLEALWDEHDAHAERDERDTRADRMNKRTLVPMEAVVGALVEWIGQQDGQARSLHAEDVTRLNQLSLLLRARLDDDPDLKVEMYDMDHGEVRARTRTEAGGVDLAVGRSKGYQGDDVYFTDGVTSLQLHRVQVRDKAGADLGAMLGIRVRVPRELAGGVLVQA